MKKKTVSCLAMLLAAVLFCLSGCGKEEPKPIRKGKDGKTVFFGHYEQDGKEKNGPEEIEWIILEDNPANGMLLISKKGLAWKHWNEEDTNDLSWSTCSLNLWLNHEFLEEAFTEEELSLISLCLVENGKEYGYKGFKVDEGDTVLERVYLLSASEAIRYFGNPEKGNTAMMAAMTPAVIKAGAYPRRYYQTEDGEEAGFWWLRSRGDFEQDAAVVWDSGEIGSSAAAFGEHMVRPVLWIAAEAVNEYLGE